MKVTEMWVAKVILIYTQVSLLTAFSKLIEKLMFNKFIYF